MRKGKGHGFFCCCELCKLKRRTSLCYMGSLFALIIILLYQAFLLILFTTKVNAMILFILMICIIIGFGRILF